MNTATPMSVSGHHRAAQCLDPIQQAPVVLGTDRDVRQARSSIGRSPRPATPA